MKKRLILGLARKRPWQLLLLNGLLVLFGLSVRWWMNWHYAGGCGVWELIEQDNTQYLAYVLLWRPSMVKAKYGWTLLH